MNEIFNLSSLDFCNNEFDVTLKVVQDNESKVEIYQTLNKPSKEVVFSYLKTISSDDIIKLGEKVAKEIKKYPEGINLILDGNINQELLLESILLVLTDINIFRKDYTKAKSYKVNTSKDIIKSYEKAYKKAEAYHLARMLNHLPYDICNSESLALNIQDLLADNRFEIEIMRQKECEDKNIIGVLSLAKGSKYEPAVIKITFNNGGNKKVGLVGKGIMFDTGGYNLKSGDFGTMKTDMAGAGAVIGALKTLANLDVKCNVVGYLMTVDNFINEKAYIPGEVLRYSNGVSVEIANTDAEGRLVLADGLILASKDKCDTIIDIATLTGNAAAALGKAYAPMYSTNLKVQNIFVENNGSPDKVWPMPLPQEYNKFLEGNISDIRNMSSTKHAGSIMAALFLQHFVDKNVNWVHIDMGAMSRKEEYGTPSNAYGVRLLSQFVKDYEEVK